MRWICLLALLFLSLPAHAGHSAPKVFLRVHIQTEGSGLPEAQAIRVPIPPNGEPIQIRALAEATERDLIGISQDPGGAVHLQFNHQGQVNISAATAQNEGRILIVMINGVVVYAPIIDEQISTGELVLPRPINPNVLLQLQETARKNVKEEKRT